MRIRSIICLCVLAMMAVAPVVNSASDRAKASRGVELLSTSSDFIQRQRLTASDGGPEDQFGRPVAISGNIAIVGQELDDSGRGAVYVFMRIDLEWVEVQKLTASDGVAGDRFGSSLGISGDTIVVGAPNHNAETPDNGGAVYVFVRGGDNMWTERQELVSSEPGPAARFGNAVAISGHTLVVGERFATVDGRAQQGAAYVFVRQGDTWTEQQRLVASDGAAGDLFGSHVAVNGDTAVVVAPSAQVGSSFQQGAAYVFVQNVDTWTEQQKLAISEGVAFQGLGPAAIIGDTIMLGQPNTSGARGAVFVFERAGAVWSEEQILTASDGASGDAFGSLVEMSGNKVAILAPGDDIGASQNQGSAYIFERISSGWVEQQKLFTDESTQDFELDNSVDISPTDVIFGHFLASVDGNLRQGAAYIFSKERNPDTGGVFRPSNGQVFLRNSNTTGNANFSFAFGVAGDQVISGDWDGDGIDTVGVYRNGVFFLKNSNTIGFADITFAFGTPGAQPLAGDWDGDGVDTIGTFDNGTFSLRNSNSSGAPDAVYTLGIAGDVAIAGDWNADGADTTGVFRPSNGLIFLKNSNTTGFADIVIVFGVPNDRPVAGDWNADGTDTIGVYRNGTFHLRNSNTTGFADIVFSLGIAGDLPIVGDWNGLP